MFLQDRHACFDSQNLFREAPKYVGPASSSHQLDSGSAAFVRIRYQFCIGQGVHIYHEAKPSSFPAVSTVSNLVISVPVNYTCMFKRFCMFWSGLRLPRKNGFVKMIPDGDFVAWAYNPTIIKTSTNYFPGVRVA